MEDDVAHIITGDANNDDGSGSVVSDASEGSDVELCAVDDVRRRYVTAQLHTFWFLHEI